MWCQNVLAITHATQRDFKNHFILVMIPKSEKLFWVTRCDKTVSENGSFLLALQPLLFPFTSKKFAKKVWELLIFFLKFGSKANSSAKIIAVTMCSACWPCQHPLVATEPCDQPTRPVLGLQVVRDAGCSARSVESFVKLDRASTAPTRWTP